MPLALSTATMAWMSGELAAVDVGSYPPVHFTSMSPKPLFARWAFRSSTVSAADMSGTSRMSSLARASWGSTVLPPGPV